MLVAEVLRLKNFQSYGNTFTEFNLKEAPKTLFQGLNGSGKSTALVDALSFAWFGKAYRDINKAMMVNTVNAKGAVVEVEHTFNGKRIRVVRGISPAIFEIWEDGVETDTESKVAEKQARLERDLLGFNETGFRQFICLSIVSYKPFMRLDTPEKRKVLESLFDTFDFTKLESDFAKRLTVMNSQVRDVEFEVNQLLANLEGLDATLNDISASNESNQEKLESERAGLVSAAKKAQKRIEKAGSLVTEEMNSELDDVRQRVVSFTRVKNDARLEHEKIRELVNYLKENEVCHTCHGPITPDFRTSRFDELKEKAKAIEDRIRQAAKDYDEASVAYTSMNERVNAAKAEQDTIVSEARSIIRESENRVQVINHILDGMKATNNDGIQERRDQVSAEYKEKSLQLQKLKFKRDVVTRSRTIVSDKGELKTSIIRRHIPMLNSLINEYLDVLGLDVRFTIDEDFNEKVYARYMDQFTYNSFSEGQKKRIDLAILMAFREIAMVKNSVSTNILILDEIVEQSLDPEGAKAVKNLIDKLAENCNIFIITPYDAIKRSVSFDVAYTFELEGNFTKVTKVNY